MLFLKHLEKYIFQPSKLSVIPSTERKGNTTTEVEISRRIRIYRKRYHATKGKQTLVNNKMYKYVNVDVPNFILESITNLPSQFLPTKFLDFSVPSFRSPSRSPQERVEARPPCFDVILKKILKNRLNIELERARFGKRGKQYERFID